MENSYSKGKIAHIAGITAIACSILGALTFNNAHAVQTSPASTFNLTVINSTKDCPVRVDVNGTQNWVSQNGGKGQFNVPSNAQAAVYEYALFQGKCAVASNLSTSIYAGTVIQQMSQVAWAAPFKISASIDNGSSQSIALGSTLTKAGKANDISITITQ